MEDMKSVDTDGCKRLWAAVAQNAVENSLTPGIHRKQRREEARKFMLESEGMFDWIATVVGFDPDAARERMKAKWEEMDRKGDSAAKKRVNRNDCMRNGREDRMAGNGRVRGNDGRFIQNR